MLFKNLKTVKEIQQIHDEHEKYFDCEWTKMKMMKQQLLHEAEVPFEQNKIVGRCD